MSSERTYPYKAWFVMPSGKPVEVELIENAGYFAASWDLSAKGKAYSISDLHPTKEDAITWALARLEAQQSKLDKQQATLEKKLATLEKARTT